jgi:low temperature requirement protein LtrA
MRMPDQATETTGATSVSQLELFFDLVFVFTITQLTTLLSKGLSWRNVSAGLWWSYFGSSDTDDDQGDVERAFAAATGPDRPRLAFRAFGYAFFVMLFGIVLTAVGLRLAVARPDSTLSTAAALALSGGVVIFLLGLTAFRVILGLKRVRAVRAAPLGLLVAVPVAAGVSALAGLAVLVAGLSLLLATDEPLEQAVPRPRPERDRAPQPGERSPGR